MTTSSSSDPPMTRIQTTVAHSLPWVLAGAVASRTLWYLGYIPLVADGYVFGGLMLAMFFFRYHISVARLCLRCMRNTPLNPGREVKTMDRLLRVEHSGPKVNGLSLLFCLVFIVGIPLIFGPGFWAERVAPFPLDVFFFGSLWATWTHHRLRPWCPYCKDWGDEGDPELVPDPDPAERMTR